MGKIRQHILDYQHKQKCSVSSCVYTILLFFFMYFSPTFFLGIFMVGKNVLLCMPKKANTDERRDQVPVLGELRVFFYFARLGYRCCRWCNRCGEVVEGAAVQDGWAFLLVTAGRSPDIGIRERPRPDNVN